MRGGPLLCALLLILAVIVLQTDCKGYKYQTKNKKSNPRIDNSGRKKLEGELLLQTQDPRLSGPRHHYAANDQRRYRERELTWALNHGRGGRKRYEDGTFVDPTINGGNNLVGMTRRQRAMRLGELSAVEYHNKLMGIRTRRIDNLYDLKKLEAKELYKSKLNEISDKIASHGKKLQQYKADMLEVRAGANKHTPLKAIGNLDRFIKEEERNIRNLRMQKLDLNKPLNDYMVDLDVQRQDAIRNAHRHKGKMTLNEEGVQFPKISGKDYKNSIPLAPKKYVPVKRPRWYQTATAGEAINKFGQSSVGGIFRGGIAGLALGGPPGLLPGMGWGAVRGGMGGIFKGGAVGFTGLKDGYKGGVFKGAIGQAARGMVKGGLPGAAIGLYKGALGGAVGTFAKAQLSKVVGFPIKGNTPLGGATSGSTSAFFRQYLPGNLPSTKVQSVGKALVTGQFGKAAAKAMGGGIGGAVNQMVPKMVQIEKVPDVILGPTHYGTFNTAPVKLKKKKGGKDKNPFAMDGKLAKQRRKEKLLRKERKKKILEERSSAAKQVNLQRQQRARA